jgi:hypothetical protein
VAEGVALVGRRPGELREEGGVVDGIEVQGEGRQVGNTEAPRPCVWTTNRASQLSYGGRTSLAW